MAPKQRRHTKSHLVMYQYTGTLGDSVCHGSAGSEEQAESVFPLS